MKLLDIFESHNSLLQEAARIGREYQHLEDLLITDGSKGGIEAVTELKSIVQQPGTMNMKWDGGAAVFWGRDENGNFVFAPNNQWSKGQKLDREGLATEIQGTGRPRQGQTPEEFAAIRQGMANNYMRLWDLFEKATPKDFRGYLNGDLMFTERQTPGADGYYEFTPNKVTYRVSPRGLYGKMKTAEAFVAVHGKIAEFGAEATGNLEPVPDAEIERFNKTRKLIVLPTQHPTVQLKPIDQEVATTLGLIKNNITDIDTIANYTADKFTGFKKILYDYAVKRAKSDGILTFEVWLKDSKLSPKQKATTQEVITTHAREWKVFWTVFDAILKLKHDVLNDLHDVHSKHMDDKLGITAITAGSPGGEGYVKAMPSGGMAKLVNPKFRSAPDNPRFTPHLNENVPGAGSKRNHIDWIKHLDGVLNVGTDDSIFFALGSIGKKIDYLPRKFPSITRRLNKSKDKIIKTILENLRDGNENSYLEGALRALKMFEITWPELDIIQKSAEHELNKQNTDTSIDEAWDYSYYLNSHHLVRSKILQGLNSVDRSIYWPLAETLEFPDKAENSIIFGIRYIYGYRNSITSTIADRLEPYKKQILKELLSDIAESGIDSASNKLLIGLRAAGITWPELDIIQKSIDYELNKPTELDEGYRDIIWSKSPGMSDEELTKLKTHWFEGDKDAEDIHNGVAEIGILMRSNKFTDYNQAAFAIPYIEKYKHQIIHRLLINAKRAFTGMPIFGKGVLNFITTMKNIGITWPELDAIQKSVDYDLNKSSKLDEGYRDIIWSKSPIQSDGNAVQRITDALFKKIDRPNVDELFDWVTTMSGSVPNEQRAEVFKNPEVVKKIRAWLDKWSNTKNTRTFYKIFRYLQWLKNLSPPWPPAVMSTKTQKNIKKYFATLVVPAQYRFDLVQLFKNIDTLDHMGYRDIPDITAILIENKTLIIKQLLTVIQEPNNYNATSILEVIRRLKRYGVDWPELDIIQISANHIKDDLNSRVNNQINEEDEGPNKFYNEKNQLHRLDGPAVIGKLGSHAWYKNGKRHRIDGPALTSPPKVEPTTRISAWYINDIDITHAMSTFKHRFIIAGDKDDPSGLSLFWLNDKKKEVITFILQLIKNKNDAAVALPFLHILRKVGVDWPELDAIEKSARYDDMKQLTETLNDFEAQEDIRENLSYIIDAITRHAYDDSDLWMCLHHLGDFYVEENDRPLPNKSQLFNRHKTGLLTHILKSIAQEGASTSGIIHCLIALKKMGVTWPELDLIQRSIEHDIKNKKTDLDEDDTTKVVRKKYVKNEENDNEIREYLYYVDNALYQNDYNSDELWGSLHFLGQYFTGNNEYPLPNESKLFKSHKKGMLKYILNYISKYGLRNYDVQAWVTALKKMRVTWPELDVIQKSIDYELKIKKSNLDEARYWSPKFGDWSTNDRDLYNKLQSFIELIEYNAHYNDLIENLLDLSKNTKTNNLPNVANLLEPHKKLIIYAILKHISKFTNKLDFYTLNNAIDILINLGANWAELLTIKNSIEHVIYDRNNIDVSNENKKSNLDEAKFNWPERFGRWSTNNENLFYELTNFIDILNEEGVSWSDLTTSLKLIAYSAVGPRLSLPNITKLVEPHKKKIIHAFLKIVTHDLDSGATNDGITYKYFINLIDMFIKMGVTWPELATIKNSVVHDFNVINKRPQLDESKGLDYDLNSLFDNLRSSSISNIFFILSAIGYNHRNNNLPNIENELEPYKNEILKSILTYFKKEYIECPYNHDRDFKFGVINRVIKVLKDFGVKWSELDMIEKSIHAEYSQKLDEEINRKDLDEEESDYNFPLGYDIFRDSLGQLLKYLLNNPNDDYIWDLLYHIGYSCVHSEKTAPNLSTFLGRYKKLLIKHILQCLSKTSSESFTLHKAAVYWIAALVSLGCDWPELKIIQRSLEHDNINRKNLNEEDSNKGVVWSFLRGNPMHWGHLGLVNTMIREAKRRGYDWKFFTSSKQEPEKNPLSYEKKVEWMLKLYPMLEGHIVIDPTIKTPLTAATYLYQNLGYRASVFVAGEDDMPAYSEMINKGNQHGRDNPELLTQGRAFLFDPCEFVHSERLTSATSVRKTVADNDPQAFTRAILGPRYNEVSAEMRNEIEKNMFNDVRQGMTMPIKTTKKKLQGKS